MFSQEELPDQESDSEDLPTEADGQEASDSDAVGEDVIQQVQEAVDQLRERASGPALFIDAVVHDQRLEHPQLIVGVDDRVVLFQPDQFSMAPQHLGANRVEGPEPRQPFARCA